MKLFEVTSEITTYLVAEDEPDKHAMNEAVESEIRDCGAGQGFATCREITKIEDIPKNIRDTLPYGDATHDLTLQGWIEQIASERKPPDDPNQTKLFDAAN